MNTYLNLAKDNSSHKNYYLKKLDASYTTPIQKFLNNHQIFDKSCNLKQVYTIEYVYWLLRQIPTGMCISIMCKTTNKIIGILCSTIIESIIKNKSYRYCLINILCIHSKLRNFNYENILISELKKISTKSNFNGIINPILSYDDNLPGQIYPNTLVSETYAIPINVEKLAKIGFVTEDFVRGYSLEKNLTQNFKLATKTDIMSLTTVINYMLIKYDISQNFDAKIVMQMFFPRKNIVYTYVKKDEYGSITDFISLTKTQTLSLEGNIIINNAVISYYFVSTISLTEMFISIIPILTSNDFDQIIIKGIADSRVINITKFITNASYKIQFLSDDIPSELNPKKFFIEFYG